jgi:hypothetical protein
VDPKAQKRSPVEAASTSSSRVLAAQKPEQAVLVQALLARNWHKTRPHWPPHGMLGWCPTCATIAHDAGEHYVAGVIDGQEVALGTGEVFSNEKRASV